MPIFTLADLRSKAYGRVDNNTALYTLAEIDNVINEALKIVGLFTGFYRVTLPIPGFSVANQSVYAVPDGIVAPTIITFEGRCLQKISMKRLARQRRTFATDTTAARGRVEYWSPIGNTYFVISPKDSIGGRAIDVTGMGEPPVLVNANDVMSLENEYVELVTEYGAHRLPLKEGGKIFADGSVALNAFYAKLKARTRYERMKWPSYRLLGAKREEAK